MVNGGTVSGGRRLTEGRYWGEAVNGGAVLGGRLLTEGRYWGGRLWYQPVTLTSHSSGAPQPRGL